MSRVEFYYNSQILYCVFYFVKFLVCSSDEIISANISAIYIEDLMAILNSLLIHFFLHVRTCSNKESFLMFWIDL